MNYLGLVGLLGLTGAGGRPAGPGRRPDRRPRRRRADGGLRDPGGAARARALRRGAARRRLDGRRRALLAGDGRRRATSPTASVPRRGDVAARRLFVCYLPYECADGWVTLRRARAEVLAGASARASAARTWSSTSSSRRARDAHARGRRDLPPRARATSGRAFNDEHDCCIEPVLDLDEALDSELVRAREMVVELEQPGADRPGPPARRPGQALAHARRPAPRARPRRSASTPTRCCARPATPTRRSRRCASPGAVGGGRGRRRGRSWHERRPRPTPDDDGLLQMSELAEASGVAPGRSSTTCARALLPRAGSTTSRNMAYYPPEFVDRIQLIKRLQEERFMPLKVIKGVLDEDPERPRRWSRSRTGSSSARSPAQPGERLSREVRERYGVPQEVLDRLAEIEVLTPNSRGYARATCRSSRRSAASAPAATTSRSASPSTTPCATARRWSRSSRRGRDAAGPARRRGAGRARGRDPRSRAPSRCAT